MVAHVSRPGKLPPMPPRPAKEGDTLHLRLHLESGRFESSISIPFPCTRAEFLSFADSWMSMMMAGLKVGSEARAAKEGLPESDVT